MPRGIYDRKKETIEAPVVVEEPVKEVKVEKKVEAPKKKERQYSNNKDHKGEGHPLCLNCGHREDMHYVEHRWVEKRVGKNLQGDFLEIEVQKREPVYTGSRPCQHACLCKQYE